MPPARIVLKNILLCALVLPILTPSGVLARDQDGTGGNEKLVACRMTFNLKGWSAFYKTAKGDGTIRCDNGQQARVRIRATGGGITFGKSADAQALTKGEVSLSLVGTGRGVDIGFAFGKFTLEKAK